MKDTAFYPADILLPSAERGIDLTKWAVVACDQYTSQPDYWNKVEELVGDSPSALRMILPEIYLSLEKSQVNRKISEIQRSMNEYLQQGLFQACPKSYIYIERILSDGTMRKGLLGMLDLEEYDYHPGSSSRIRATEGTVLERIPPRVRVREHAVLEFPHIMMLIDDLQRTVIEPLSVRKDKLPLLYRFPLMQGGGNIAGYRVQGRDALAVQEALEKLAQPEAFSRRYGLPMGTPPLLYAAGDGNHSLATAKACFEALKQRLPEEEWKTHPARYALAEVVNLHDDSLQFEPIHRAVTGTEPEKLLKAMEKACGARRANGSQGDQTVTAVTSDGTRPLLLTRPTSQLAVGTLQNFLDQYLTENTGTVDYIHGDDVAVSLGQKPNSIAFLLPPMGKEELFPTVILDGSLPRKTFSMGHAQDKRYYIEGRRITY